LIWHDVEEFLSKLALLAAQQAAEEPVLIAILMEETLMKLF